jgi:phospholipid-transporting ATPase
MKDLAEDLKRHLSDREENNKTAQVYTEGGFKTAKWFSIRVGDIIKV